MSATMTLEKSIDTAFTAMDEKRRNFQVEETQKHKEWQLRLEKLGKTFDGLSDVWKPKLEVLMKKFGDKVAVKPSLTNSTRDVAMEFQSDVAKIRLRFQATADHDIKNIILNYDLEIIPVLMKFESHAELSLPLEAVDRDAISKWIDERIMSFVKIYISVHENRYYLTDQMVQDPISGTQFPKLAAGATLERDGKTYYFISEDTRRQFEAKNGKPAK